VKETKSINDILNNIYNLLHPILVFNNINKFNKAIDLLEDNNELVDANNDLANGDNNVLIKGTNYTTGLSGVDPSTEVIEFIDHEHHEIHEGNSFRSFSNKDVSNSGDYNIAFKNSCR